MKFEKTEVSGFEAAFRGMRNPKNSWHLSDSYFGFIDLNCYDKNIEIAEKWKKWMAATNEKDKSKYYSWLYQQGILQISTNIDKCNGAIAAFIGPKDMKLAQSLIRAGSEHRKFLRQINVSVDITAPLYWWKELDTYKIGTAANSTSTMHTLIDKVITIDCFETDDYEPTLVTESSTIDGEPLFNVSFEVKQIIDFLNTLREKYLETKDRRYWKELVRWLPESWLQTRTWSANYEVLFNIYYQREHHKLTEWNQFLNWICTLPYANDLIDIY